MEKCECGSEDWKEIGSTWLCMACKGKEYEDAIRDLTNGLERMKRAEQVMSSMKINTTPIRDLLYKLTKEVEDLGK